MNKKLSILLAVLVLLSVTLACGTSTTAAPAGISNIQMSTDQDGANATTTFAPTDTIYVTFDVNEVDTGAALQVRWYALNVEGQDPETPFTTTDYTYNDEGSIYAQIESTDGGFPAGQYKVEIYLNGAKVGEEQFSVQ
jgi:hypothetical protein